MRGRAEHGLQESLERELWGGLTRFREMDRAGEMWGRPYQTPLTCGALRPPHFLRCEGQASAPASLCGKAQTFWKTAA